MVAGRWYLQNGDDSGYMVYAAWGNIALVIAIMYLNFVLFLSTSFPLLKKCSLNSFLEYGMVDYTSIISQP